MTFNIEEPLWVIVEGPDGGGKSTAVKELAHVLACAQMPTVVQKTSWYTEEREYVGPPIRWNNDGLCVVQDRSFMSEHVYAGVVGRDTKWDRAAHLTMTRSAVRAGAIMLFFVADLPALESRVSVRGDDYVVPQQLKQICLDYGKVLEDWEMAGGVVYTFDTTREFPGVLELQLAVSVCLAEREKRHEWS